MDAPRSPRRSAPFILGLLAILAALPVGYFVFLRQPPAPPPPPVVEAPAPPPPEKRPVEVDLKLKEIRGTVEVRRGDGEWRPASAGEALRPSDAVRTLEGSYALLIGGEAVEVQMEAGAEITVETLTAQLSRLRLGNGMTTIRVTPGASQTVEVKAVGSDAEARTEGGTFSMSNNGKGTVAVGTREGEVSFRGQGKVVIIRAGQQSIVHPGRGPSEPAPIPTSLLLKVNWPTHPRRKTVISGQTEPGTQVHVAGKPIPTDKEGRFSHSLPLKEGPNSVKVQARSVGGLSQEASNELTVDTTPPSGPTVDSELWEKPR